MLRFAQHDSAIFSQLLSLGESVAREGASASPRPPKGCRR